MLAVGASHPGQEGGGCLFDEATPDLAGPEGSSQVPLLTPGPGGGAQQQGSRTLDVSLGTQNLRLRICPAKVLTNGFETCLLRPRDQPLAERKFPGWLSVFWWPPVSSLSSPPPSELGLWPWGLWHGRR